MNNFNFDNSPNANFVINLNWMYCVFIIGAIISTLFEVVLLERIYNDDFFTYEEAEFNDKRQLIISTIQFLFYLFSMGFFIRWFYYGYKKLHEIDNMFLLYKPKMAIWGFFIPFINLVRPYKIAKEILTNNKTLIEKKDEEYKFDSKDYIVVTWWTIEIISNIYGNIVFRMSLRAEEIDELILNSKMIILSDFLNIVAAIVTIYLIKHINKYEKVVYNLYKSEVNNEISEISRDNLEDKNEI